MSSKKNYSKKILRILGEKPAVILDSLKDVENSKDSYAMTRSVKNLIESGNAEILNFPNKKLIRITKKGRTKLDTLKLEGKEALVPQTWDGM